MNLIRCEWATKSPLLMNYHDQEWGVPIFDDEHLFEALSLEIFQAGLTWDLILKRRSAFRQAFKNFNVQTVAKFSDVDVERLVNDASIIRNRAKIIATIANARAIFNLQQHQQTFSDLIWRLVNFCPLNHMNSGNSQDYAEFIKPFLHELQLNNFKRCGPVTVYSFLQSAGIVNDHEMKCFRYHQLLKK